MKSVVLVGLNYLTTPLEIREQVYLSGNELAPALVELKSAGLSEVVILSTCNRLEIYGVADASSDAVDVISAFLTRLSHDPLSDLQGYLYFLHGHHAARHLMRVACGLESLVLGETQILGQVANAFGQAQIACTDGIVLSRLFTSALHTGKRARTETAISEHSLSISHAAASLVKSKFDNTASLRVLVVGAGEMAELAVHALAAQGIKHVWLINRTDENAERLSKELGIQFLVWNQLPTILKDFDVIIAATAAAQPVIEAGHFFALGENNRKSPLLLVDIGVPRNIEPEVKSISKCLLYDIDLLSSVVENHRQQRQAEVGLVEQVIAEELNSFIEWFRAREVVPLIAQLRSRAEAVAQSEVEQTLRRLPGLSPHEQDILNQMAHRIVNKILHAPTVSLKNRAANNDHYDYTHALRQLFALDEHKSA